MKKLLPIVTIFALASAMPVEAQMDWMTPHLESQRWKNQRRATQNKKKTTRTTRQRTSQSRQTKKSQTTSRKIVERPVRVVVNGRPLKSSAAATVDGHAFVAFRDIFEALGATVNYNNNQRLITATRGSANVQLSLPGSTVNVKGNRVGYSRSETPYNRNGVIMVPLRMVSEKMGAQVSYLKNQAMPTISVTDNRR